MQVFIHEIKLEEKDDFSAKFNRVSDLYRRSEDETLTEEERKEAFKQFFDAKLALEMGY